MHATLAGSTARFVSNKNVEGSMNIILTILIELALSNDSDTLSNSHTFKSNLNLNAAINK